MTHEDAGHYAAKHPVARLNPNIAAQVEEELSEGCIACSAAFAIAQQLQVTPAEVGVTMDLLEARIIKCQLGLFGYQPKKMIVKPSEQVEPALQQAIKERLINGRLPCAAAWEIAEKLGRAKMQVSAACEKLKIKICTCQLGSFN